MTDVRFVPATGTEAWRLAVSTSALAVLSPAVTAQTAEAVWRRLDGGGIGALVEALTGAFGTSLTAIPPFALVVVEADDVRVAVRGPIDVVVEGDAGPVEVSGRGVATWVERLLTRPSRVRVRPGDGDGGDETLALPLASGVVPASGVVLTLGTRTTPGEARAAAAEVVPAVSEPVQEPAVVAEPAEPEPAVEQGSAVEPEPVEPEPVEPEPVRDTAAGGDTWIPTQTRLPAATTTAVPPADEPSGLVDGVPDLSSDSRPGRTPDAAPDEVPADDRTLIRGAAPGGAPAGDHDGATISVAAARALRAAGGAASPFEPVADVPARQPARGRVRLSSGKVIELERPVVIGRRPRSPRASGAELPTLIAVESPQGDISRSHIEIRAEGEHVLVTDLATTNGTVLLRGGQEPVRLHPSEPTMVVTGDVLDLGDGVTVTFEDLP